MSTNKLVELSYPLSANYSRSNWPGNSFSRTTVLEGSDNRFGHFIAMYDVSVSEHYGTHMDAPFHFNKTAWTVDKIPLDR